VYPPAETGVHAPAVEGEVVALEETEIAACGQTLGERRFDARAEVEAKLRRVLDRICPADQSFGLSPMRSKT
jgi:hypothetical protein